jgi:hypothetical protein
MNFKITKSNYKQFFKDWSRRDFRRYKRRLKMDLKNNPLIFSKYYKPVKSAIYNELGISIQGGKDNRYWNYNQS